MLSIVEILKLRGLSNESKIKMVRHRDKKFDVHELFVTGQLPTYQSYQAKPIFECDYVISFLGLAGSRARFIGVYKVKGKEPAQEVELPNDFLYPEMETSVGFYYNLERVTGFEDLEERVVIDWGGSALAWHQWLKDKEVIEILPRGYSRDFPGFLDFVLTFDELERIVQNPEANREWTSHLSEVAGVYLILDSRSGSQYIGSAYGSGGIIARWQEYVRTGHGGNLMLRPLVQKNKNYRRHFRFSILRTLSKTLTNREVVAYERLYKEKLGTRAFGLNPN